MRLVSQCLVGELLGTVWLLQSEKNVVSMRKLWPRARLQVWKNGGNFGSRVRTFYKCFPNFPGKKQDFMSLIESWCIVFVGIQYFKANK